MAQAAEAFERIADDYDRNRPAYPDALVDAACRIAGLRAGDRVLELGCGSGQLTRSLAARELRVSAVEPGRRLLALARRNLAGAAGVEFVNARFEDAELPGPPFQAVFAAASFHWIDPDVSWSRTARALAPGGALALLQYCGLATARSAGDQRALHAALAAIAPEAAAAWPPLRELAAIEAGVERRRANLSEAWSWIAGHELARPHAAELFNDVRSVALPAPFDLPAAALNAQLCTFSFFERLTSAQQRALEAATVAIERRLGRPIRSDVAALLVTARATVSP